MQAHRLALLAVLRTPSALLDLDARTWETVLSLGRRHGVSGRWHAQLAALGASGRLAPAIADQLYAEALVAEHRAVTLRWEIACIQRALAGACTRLVLLKGAAYLLAGLPPATARISSDVDILVPHGELGAVEAALHRHGWRSLADNPYDQAYFRAWMHELPPMQHVGRGTVIDVHHNILPRTARPRIDPGVLLAGATASAIDGIELLQPTDMLLHSIVHGFHDGEFLNGLRDVLDVHELASHFARAAPTFWDRLVARSLELGLTRPAWHGLSAARRYFDTAVPEPVLRALGPARPLRPLHRVLQQALDEVLVPPAPARVRTRAAARFLQARAHWNKMPLALLVRHLGYKTWLRVRGTRTAAPVTAPERF